MRYGTLRTCINRRKLCYIDTFVCAFGHMCVLCILLDFLPFSPDLFKGKKGEHFCNLKKRESIKFYFHFFFCEL